MIYFAEGGADSSVALAAIGAVVTSVGTLAWIIKYFLTSMKKSLDDNTKSNIKVADTNKDIAHAVHANTRTTEASMKVSEATLLFMDKLNGKLAHAANQTMREQTDGES